MSEIKRTFADIQSVAIIVKFNGESPCYACPLDPHQRDEIINTMIQTKVGMYPEPFTQIDIVDGAFRKSAKATLPESLHTKP
jgi:hypothetical protein